MPTQKRKLAQLQNEKVKIAKSNKSITSFFGKSGNTSTDTNPEVSQPASIPETTDSEPCITDSEMDQEVNTATTPTKKQNSRHKIGVNKEWLTQYPWLYFDTETDDDSTVDVMMCRLCSKHRSNSKNGNRTWSSVGYRLLRKDKVQLHQDSDQHKYSITLEMTQEVDGMASKINTGAQKAILDALKVLYFILQNNLPLDLFGPTIDLCIDVGATDLSNLRLAKNATYSSYDTVHELLDILSEKVQQLLIEDVKASPCYAIMVDEVTDNRTLKHLALCTRYINKEGDVKTAFLTDTELPNATADSITTTIQEELNKHQLSIRDMAGFASDGAAVFTGNRNGVAKQLKEQNPDLITHHCRDHRLALACRDSFLQIPVMKKLDNLLEAIWKYYKYSCKNSDSLKSIQKALDEAPLTIKLAKHHRWLSHEQAITSIVKTYRSLIVDLESAEISKDPVGHGLLKNLRDSYILRALLLLADILPHVSNLSLTFQKREVHLGTIKTSIEKTITILEKRKSEPGTWLLKESQLKRDTDNKSEQPTDFDSKVREPFLDALINNIKLRFKDADVITELSILDLTGTDDLALMYGYTEMESLAQRFNMDPETLLMQWQDFIQLISASEKVHRSLPQLQKMFISADYIHLNLREMYPLVCRLYSMAVIQPLSTAEVERVFSQVKLIKTSHRSSLKTSTLTKILNVKFNCDDDVFSRNLDDCTTTFFARKNRRLKSIV